MNSTVHSCTGERLLEPLISSARAAAEEGGRVGPAGGKGEGGDVTMAVVSAFGHSRLCGLFTYETGEGFA